MEEIERAVSSYTKAIIVNSPNNPSGVVYLRGVHRARSWSSARRKSIYLIMDDIYHKLVFDGTNARHRLQVHRRRTSRTRKVIVVNGVSKLYGMTGFRIGWAVAQRASWSR